MAHSRTRSTATHLQAHKQGESGGRSSESSESVDAASAGRKRKAERERTYAVVMAKSSTGLATAGPHWHGGTPSERAGKRARKTLCTEIPSRRATCVADRPC